MSDIEKRVRYLYMYYLKEGVEDQNHIINYILDDIGSTIDNVKLIQSIFKEDNTELTEEQQNNILEDAKELEEQGYFDQDSYVNILENYLEKDEAFSVKKAYEYMEHLKYDPDSDLYIDLDDTEMFESYINKEE